LDEKKKSQGGGFNLNLLSEAGNLQDNGVAFAIATIISAEGSTPRNTAKMIIQSDGSTSGTIGGGPLELYVIREAMAAIRDNRSKVVEYNLNSDAQDGIEMLCGGVIHIFMEVIAARPRVVMIGAGHVGTAIARLTELLSYYLAIVDNRPEYANSGKYPMAAEIVCEPDIQAAVAKLKIDANTYIVIATADVDYPAIRAVINSGAAYIGMIGSKRKAALIKEKLEQEGVAREKLQNIYAPVGLDIGSETPEEIAVSVLAEIMKVKNGKTGQSMRESGLYPS
jgi:Xanthine and CO dehydrogenases maturation factor, XdhC/CoxF family